MKDERGDCRSLWSYLLCSFPSPSGPVCLSEARYWKYSRNIWYDALVPADFYSRCKKYWNMLWFKSGAELYQYKCRPGLHRGPASWVNDCESCCMAGWSVFISLFIDSLAFLWVFEINNSQQKSDRGMKISTFPAVKPFIKLTRGRMGVEERRGKVTFGEGAESGREAGAVWGRGGRENDVGYRGEGKEAKFVWEEEESHLEDSRADKTGGAVCHSKTRGRDRKKDKFDIGV